MEETNSENQKSTNVEKPLEMEETNSENQETTNVEKVEFKKPVLIGRVGKLPKNIKKEAQRPPEPKEAAPSQPEASGKGEDSPKSSLPPAVLLKELSTPIPYKEPKWSGLCPDGTQYALEVLKSGVIVDNVDLTKKPYYVFGRLANCDVVMAHPTISRHHCVLQYKAFCADGEGEPPAGWYLRDSGSTHGTFLNRERLAPGRYVRVRVGHHIRLGASTRTYVVLGPDYDCEGESDLTVTEIKQKALELKLDRDRLIREAVEERERRRQEEERRREEQGIDWGMGEDADESADLSVNPFAPGAEGAEAELQLADPKKSLRGYFEREGHELVYQCEERGPGQFLCRVELPLDDALGRPLVAEVLHRGRKKEAVAACALEACRALERAGALRQPTRESKRRKRRDWAADDFYDSDEDAFLDRTGAVERKRKRRIRAHGGAGGGGGESGAEGGGGGVGGGGQGKALTYDDLLKQITEIEAKISFEEKTLERLRASGGGRRTAGGAQGEGEDGGEDELDAYMAGLAHQGMTMATKAHISQTKMSIAALQKELARTRRLADLARPAELPPLAPPPSAAASASASASAPPRGTKMAVRRAGNDVIYGKRIRLKEDAERRKRPTKETKLQDEGDFVEEIDSDDDSDSQQTPREQETSRIGPSSESSSETQKNRQNDSLRERDDAIQGEDASKRDGKNDSLRERDNAIQSEDASERDDKPLRTFGPQRPPDDYVIPENYFDQGSDRDLPNIEDKDSII